MVTAEAMLQGLIYRKELVEESRNVKEIFNSMLEEFILRLYGHLVGRNTI
jgi:hypothetical protein